MSNNQSNPKDAFYVKHPDAAGVWSARRAEAPVFGICGGCDCFKNLTENDGGAAQDAADPWCCRCLDNAGWN